MYEGYPDFQQIITSDDHLFVAAYRQDGVFYLYPQSSAILATEPPPLAFSLDIIRSYSLQVIYGKLAFTCQLQFADQKTLVNFSRQHPDSSIRVLPVSPDQLGFSAPLAYPSTLTDAPYDPTWYTAQDIQFIVLLDVHSAALIEKVLRDDIAGFGARMDGGVIGVSPRLDYTVDTNVKTLITVLADNVPGSQRRADNLVVFNYLQLAGYLAEHLTRLPLNITPVFTSTDPALIRLFSQALLDRLYNRYGQPWSGPVDSNTTWIGLNMPNDGHDVIELFREELTRRPLCFTLDPFAAAQQIAKVDINAILHYPEPLPMPDGKLMFDLFYTWPPGLSDRVNIDVQITIPPGLLYPTEQTKTLLLQATTTHLACEFYNNSPDGADSYHYQVRITWSTDHGRQFLIGELTPFTGSTLVLGYNALPCPFLTINIDPGFASSCRLSGIFHSQDKNVPLLLTEKAQWFSYPRLDKEDHAELTAEQVSGPGVVPLPTPVMLSTTIGAWCFPQFGAQRALITVHFPATMPYVELLFQAQGRDDEQAHAFTHSQPTFEYRWTVTSIFAAGFRYRTRTGEWSDYVSGDQTIDIEA
ncbi:hypothetical protein N7922_13500 [Kosakonia sp. ML.JS2a]|uniref:hypothetical protein n=1 Tax=Kosakonia sp. ML.JS2a TaxID=2980557 RepID=UPI0021DA9616|nr:hypothetical protein [Kosakonia sp. ML.JS2a]UXY08909.1 hypothetical protein N7922_13500 [Kosakonia sp. ML.JS2a]